MQSTPNRVQSVDILRGLIMLIMALDHVRDFFHITGMSADAADLATTTPLLFFTRWITHYCAPTFVFLSGLSAYLAGQKRTQKEQSIFLIKRGLWLIAVEIVVITLGLTFNPLYNVIILQVIWAIGLSMIILGLLIRTSIAVIVAIGAIIVLGHNVFDYIKIPAGTVWGTITNSLLAGSRTIIPYATNRVVYVFYTALPWTGIMLLGYGFGTYFKNSVAAEQRKKIVLRWGLFVTAFFIIMRFINHYGDPAPWSTQKNAVFTFLSFLNTTKYPCSLIYVSMTIGPSLLLLYLFENMQNKLTDIFKAYGKVPFFYYVIHFYIIHTLCVILFYASGYGNKDIIDTRLPFLFRPMNFGYQLPVVYFIWFCVITSLYRPCKWFLRYKQTHKQWWLSYM